MFIAPLARINFSSFRSEMFCLNCDDITLLKERFIYEKILFL